MSWKIKRLDEVCSLITDGKHGDCQNQPGSGYYFISAKDIVDWSIQYDNARQITKEDFEDTHRRTQLEPFDVTMVSTGASIGRVAIAKDEEVTFRTTFQKSVAILKPILEAINSFYLAYFLKYSNREIHATSSGSAQKNVLLKDLRAFKIPLPPLPTQRRIAAILSAYDDLIENNLKRIRLLEEAAQNIYREWFVHFRFPGHEEVGFGEDACLPDGRGVPVGWEMKRADSVFNIKIGKTPPRKESEWFENGKSGIKWVSIKDMNNSSVFVLNTSENITEEGVSKFNMNIAAKGTVILSFKLTIGTVGMVTEDMVTNEAIAHFNIISSQEINEYFVYCYLKAFPFDSLGSTSSIGRALNSKIVKSMPFLLPDKEVLHNFDSKTAPIFKQIENLLNQNERLKEARDILLPRLMNRTIEV